ncbi:hypothetical protein HDV05_004902 [Chytridiales sp. JEL 0842]|nr:hypothetical protein HDV05_004902 [Chytridiales sp. JEL 0842]
MRSDILALPAIICALWMSAAAAIEPPARYMHRRAPEGGMSFANFMSLQAGAKAKDGVIIHDLQPPSAKAKDGVIIHELRPASANPKGNVVVHEFSQPSSLVAKPKGNVVVHDLNASPSATTKAAAPAGTPLSTANIPKECIPIESTSVCSPWNKGYYINSTELAAAYSIVNPAISSAKEWENLLWATAVADFKAQPWKKDVWSSYLHCDGYEGEPIQYSLTYACLTDIFFFSAGCNVAAKTSVPDVPLCAGTCSNYGSALGALVNDTTACSPTKPASISGDEWADVQERRAFWLTGEESCNNLVGEWTYEKEPEQCNEGVDDDYKTCGFGGDVAAATAYCRDVKSAASCCETFEYYVKNENYTGARPVPDLSPLFPGYLGAYSQSSGFASSLRSFAVNAANEMNTFTQNNQGLTIGLAVGGSLLLACMIAAGIVVMRRRNSNNAVGNLKGRMTMKKTPPPSAAILAEREAADRRLLSGSGAPAPATVDRYVVIDDHEPDMDDEIVLVPGQIVEVSNTYDDGWGRGRNLTTGATGVFPMSCVEPENPELKTA